MAVGPCGKFEGYLANFAIFNKPPSAEEVKAIYDSPNGIEATAPSSCSCCEEMQTDMKTIHQISLTLLRVLQHPNVLTKKGSLNLVLTKLGRIGVRGLGNKELLLVRRKIGATWQTRMVTQVCTHIAVILARMCFKNVIMTFCKIE